MTLQQVEGRGPTFGYFPNASKTWLVVKEEIYDDAIRLFQGINIQITTTGKRYLSSTIGTDEIIVAKKVEERSWELKTLAKIAHSQPQPT